MMFVMRLIFNHIILSNPDSEKVLCLILNQTINQFCWRCFVVHLIFYQTIILRNHGSENNGVSDF